jgi:protocadherin Fat 4
VNYSIIAGNDLGNFAINLDNATLSVATSASIDVDLQDLYNLTIQAEDGGGLTSSTTVLINIIDANDNSPIIHYPSNFSLTLSENSVPGITIIEYINATDSDSGLNAVIDFVISSGDVTNSFTINSTTGQVIMTNQVDREAANPYELILSAVDHGIPSLYDSIKVTISVQDINDNPPTFTESVYTFYVAENVPTGHVLGTVEAHDDDAGENGTVIYTLLTNTSNFILNNITGEILTLTELDRESIPMYNLTITATDTPTNESLSLESTAEINIVVIDVNDNVPVFDQSIYFAELLDTESPGYSLITIHATDADTGTNGRVQYKFLPPINDDFAIDINTGVVTLASNIDFHSQSSYTYIVNAFNDEIISESVTLEITIHTPNIHPPIFAINEYNFTVNETLAIGTDLVNVTATDSDTGLIGEVHYRIPNEWQFSDSGSFDVDINTGSVFVNGTLDFDYNGDKNMIFFQVEAYDGGFPLPMTSRVNITVFLLNVNDEAPIIIIEPTNFPTIPENSPPGIDFFDLSIVTFDPDPDEGGMFNFTLIDIYFDYDDNISNASFSLSPNGTLTSLRTFDREAIPDGFVLSILTTDYGYPTQTALNNVTILIGDMNDQSPFYENEVMATVYELIPADQVVVHNFTALDYDIGRNALLNYAIFDGDLLDQFTINNEGTVTTTQILNKTEQIYYNLTIYVTDNGIPPLFGFGSLFVTVIDANDNSPIFNEPFNASFSEDTEIGSLIHTVNATDADEGTNSLIMYYFTNETVANITYFDNSTNTSVVRFLLNSTTGEITLQDFVDRELEEEFKLDIVAVDMGLVPTTLSSTVTITLYVEDANDNIPFFLNHSYSFDVIENTPSGIQIGFVSAYDLDSAYPNNVIEYAIIGERSDELQIDNESGYIYVNGSIDWEIGSNYTVAVVAYDLGYPSLSSQVNLTINIFDINDQPPLWDIVSLNISVNENSLPGTSVGYIMAYDLDSEGNNSLITYGIAMDFATKHFDINSTTGEVITLMTFNREVRDLYDMTVIAHDHGLPQLSSTATAYIEILDSNDNSPYFLNESFIASISEHESIGTYVLQVLADDVDVGSNGEIFFTIPSTEYSKVFYIDSRTGVITTASLLDFENTTTYEFLVLAEDGGHPSFQATTTVTIIVLDYNDNYPVFNLDDYSVTIVENIAIGTTLLRIQASDVDEKENGIIEYILLDGSDSDLFGIDNETGVLFISNFVNRENLQSSDIILTILANNSKSEVVQNSNVSVNISVLDLNDQAPSFSAYIVVNLPESTAVGSAVYTLIAADGDEGNNGTIEYSAIGGNMEIFEVNSTTGTVTLTADVENQRAYYLTINATDHGLMPLFNYTTLVFEITDENNNSPMFSSPLYFVSVSYTASVSSPIISIIAADNDVGTNANIEYSILSGNYSALFSISKSGGLIFTEQSLVTYSGQYLNVTISATDGTHNVSSEVVIHVKGSNLPVFSNRSFEVSVSENADNTSAILNMYSLASPASNMNLFTLTAGNINNTFSLTSSGLLYFDNSKVDFELQEFYQLSVKVERNSNFAYAVVFISIKDENEHTPLFSSSSYFIPVSETTIVGQPFFVLVAADADLSSPSNSIYYSITSGNIDNIFNLHPTTGVVSLNTMLDFNTNEHFYELNVTATNLLSPIQLSNYTILAIEVIDGNRHKPSFTQNLYNYEIYENVDVGTQIDINIEASDDDFGQAGNITFGLLGNHRHYDFVIDPLSGDITVGPGGLDYERNALYTLEVVASDGGVPQLSFSALVYVIVLDLNDNTPIWNSNTYHASVMENTTVGTEILVVKATDLDPIIFDDTTEEYENTNGLITYTISNGDPLSQFFISPETGIVSLNNPLDREVNSNYTLILNATDGGGLYSNAILQLSVLDINDVVPQFTLNVYTAYILENSLNGTLVTNVSAKDNDLTNGNQISYSITQGNDNNTFSINSTNGHVFLDDLIDREEQFLHRLTIAATDNDVNFPLTGYATLLIYIVDINEFPPEFDQPYYDIKVFENTSINSIIVNISATDQDFGDNAKVIYSIVDGNEQNFFKIDSETGEISVAKLLDYEIDSQYNLSVQATDSSHINFRLASEISVNISILDINDNVPVFDELMYSFNIPENVTPGAEVFAVYATDNDSYSNALLTYSIVNDSEEVTFIINGRSGVVSVSPLAIIDREYRDHYAITIVAADNGYPSLTATTSVAINVDDVNDNLPIFNSDYYEGYLMENSSPGTAIFSVSAYDNDTSANAQLEYSISSPIFDFSQCLLMCPLSADMCSVFFSNNTNNYSSSLFVFDNNNTLVSGVPFDREMQELYVLQITATDMGIPSLSSSVCGYIRITDANDEIPSFLESKYFGEIVENSPIGTFVSVVKATDRDIGLNGKIYYQIEDGTAYFTIDPINGEISNIKLLDREVQDSYNITVVALDNGTPINTQTTSVFITVIDVNDSPPMFNSSNFTLSILENYTINATVTVITASDADVGINKQLLYSIVSPSLDLVFTINETNGVITTMNSLDRESVSSYELLILVSDKGLVPLNSTASLTIDLIDVNDNAPLFSEDLYVTSFVENIVAMDYPIMTSIMTLDSDIGTNAVVYYSIVNATHYSDFFAINESNGLILFTGKLDAEITSSVNLTIKADNGDDSSYFSLASVMVNVVDMNDQSPSFEYPEYFVTILESTPIGSNIPLQIQAFDHDTTSPNNLVLYNILDDNATFTINQTTGVITTTSVFDKETTSSYEIVVAAIDGGVPSLSASVTVTILIANVNDNPPIFQQSMYHFQIYENQPGINFIGNVSAFDIDLDNVTYELCDNTSSDFFINSQNGKIYSNVSFDREFVDEYNFCVLAVDDPVYGLSSSANVSIIILDINDNEPSFSQDEYHIYASEDMPLYEELIVLNASDDDINENSLMRFSIFPNADHQYVSINETTGMLFLIKELDREEQDVINVSLVVSDYGTPVLSSSTEVILHVLDVNDNIPFFIKDSFTAVISESTTINSSVLTVTAIDYDIGTNSQLFYSLSPNVSHIFSILNSTAGVIYLIGEVDYETAHNYSFTVTVTDNGAIPLSSTADIFVAITDVNDNAPYFEKNLYNVSVPENTVLQTTIFKVPASDNDHGSNSDLQYSILNGNLNTYFSLDENTGLLRVIDYLDRESTQDFLLNVRVVDSGIPQYTATTMIHIQITDTNDNIPQFTSKEYYISIPESTEKGSVIYTVRASDDDTGYNAQLTFEIVEGNDNRTFYIDESTGMVMVNSSLNFKITPMYSLTIFVHDNGIPNLYDSTILTIILEDTNQYAPFFFKDHYAINITVQTAVGTPIAYLKANDADVHNTLSYYISNNNTDNFAVVTTSGTLYVYSALTVGSHNFIVNVSDGKFSKDLFIEVTVHSHLYTDPLFSNPTYYFEITENAPLNSVVGMVNHTFVSLSFVLPNNSTTATLDTFRLEENGSKIILNDPLDFELIPTYVLNIKGTLLSGDFVYTVLTITVTDYNDNYPSFSSDEYNILLSEFTPIGTSILTLYTYDGDTSGINSNTLLQIVEGNEFFTLSDNVIFLSQTLDREVNSSIKLSIRASNNMAMPQLYSTSIVFITVLDVNDNDPEFSKVFYVADIYENTPKNTKIIQTFATDEDLGSNADLVYSIIYQSFSNAFSIDTINGSVYTNKESFPLTDGGSSLVVSVMVADKGTPIPRASTVNLFINVHESNLGSPVFAKPAGYNISVFETEPVNSVILEVTAIDVDNDSVIYYSIQSSDPVHDNTFRINPYSGLITLMLPLNYDIKSAYSYIVYATDSGFVPITTATVLNITVIDVNTHSPVFSQMTYAANVTENAPVNTFVTQVTATDIDSIETIYQITINHMHNDMDTFTIDSNGTITTIRPIDRELYPSIKLLVSAIDTGYPVQRSTSVPVYITVIDLNDESPIFNLSTDNVNVIRLLPSNQTIAEINAYDNDFVGSQLIFNISSQSVPGLFGINPNTGMIMTLTTVPEDMLNTSFLEITVTDGFHTTIKNLTINAVNTGIYCEGNFCTSITPRQLTCKYIIPLNPLCNSSCPDNSHISPKSWVCISHTCTSEELIPCAPIKNCLPSNHACNGSCSSGQSRCKTTNICYPLSHESPCDTNICLINQTLIQRSDETRYCSLSSLLPANGRSCIGDNQIYCEHIGLCSNLSNPNLCQLCPNGSVACPDTKDCVTDIRFCCGFNRYYCEIHNSCLPDTQQCRPLNVVPSTSSSLLHVSSVVTYSVQPPTSNGSMIGMIIGNGSVAVDDQQEELSIVVTAVKNIPLAEGEWQYTLCDAPFNVCKSCSQDSKLWVTISNVSEMSALYLPSTACIRFWRKSVALEGAVWLRVKLWDGNIDGYQSNSTNLVRNITPYYDDINDDGSLSQNYTNILVLLLPLTAQPSLGSSGPQSLTPIHEDINIAYNTGDNIDRIITNIKTEHLPVLVNSYIDGLPQGVTLDMIPYHSKIEYFSQIENTNIVRQKRVQAVETKQLSGIAIYFVTESVNDWQVSFNNDPQLYVYLKDVLISPDQVLLVNTSISIRYLAPPNVNGMKSLGIRPWDGIISRNLTEIKLVHFSSVLTTNINVFNGNHFGNHNLLQIYIESIPDIPVIFQPTVLLPAIPYTIAYTYESVYVALINESIDVLRPEKLIIEDMLYLTLTQPAKIHRFYSASLHGTYVSFSIHENKLSLHQIITQISSKKSILNDVLPIVNISQECLYGPGSGCNVHESSVGLPPSFLVNDVVSSVASDGDEGFLGMAVIHVVDGYGNGVWQYTKNYSSSAEWINFPQNITFEDAFLLSATDGFRFIPKPSYYWTNSTTPQITIKVWDMSKGKPNNLYFTKANTTTNIIGLFSTANASIIATRYGCDNVVNSGSMHDVCCICGGTGDSCTASCDTLHGSNSMYDSCEICGGNDDACIGCDKIPLSTSYVGICGECVSITSTNISLNQSLFQDCWGSCFGSAVIDDCGVCTGSSTGNSYNNNIDCSGICFGNATIDDCGYCTDVASYNKFLDCTGVCNGPFRLDSCDICQLPDINGNVTEHRDCNGVCFGTALIDQCGSCFGGNTNTVENSMLDACGVCNGDNSTCYGCDGILKSGSIIDTCNTCGGNNCGCFHLININPDNGPIEGSTSITISGAGFFKNSSNFNLSLPNCGGDIVEHGSGVFVTCQFSDSESVSALGSAYIVNQSTIKCISPSLITYHSMNQRNHFSVQVRVGGGVLSNKLQYFYDNYSSITLLDVIPKAGLVNENILLTYHGKNFINTSSSACLIYQLDYCKSGHTSNAAGYMSVSAFFHNSTSISCLLPSSSNPCEVIVKLSLDGQESGIINPSSFYSKFKYSAKAPMVQSIFFAKDLTSLIISFDQPISLIGNITLSCDHIFQNDTLSILGENDAECFWGTRVQNEIHVVLPENAIVEMNSPITFKDDIITTQNNTYSFNITNKTVHVSNTRNAVKPIAVIAGPSFIPNCGNINFNGINSLYEGYKPFTYKWLIYTKNSSVSGFELVVSHLQSLTPHSKEISLPTYFFQPSTIYVIVLNVSNSIGLSSIDFKEIRKSNFNTIEVAINGPKQFSIYRDNILFVEGLVFYNGCNMLSGSYSYKWQLYVSSVVSEVPLSNAITNHSKLYLPPYVLTSNTNYLLHFTAEINEMQATDTVSLYVHSSTCSPYIEGGNRNFSVNDNILLLASTSAASYAWACSVLKSNQPCYNATLTVPTPVNFPNSLIVNISALHFQPDTYNFTLISYQKNCPSISTMITVSQETPIAIVQILTSPLLNLAVSKIISLEALVFSNYPVSVSWSCVDLPGFAYIDLSTTNFSLSPTTYETLLLNNIEPLNEIGYGIVQGRSSRTNLILKPNSLLGKQYVFQLTATYGNKTTSSSVIITNDILPVIHNISITPPTGLALDTMFNILIERATDEISDLPMYHQIGVKMNNLYYWLTGVYNNKLLQITLPEGELKLIIKSFDRNLFEVRSTYISNTISVNHTICRQSYMIELQSSLDITKDWYNLLPKFVSYLLSPACPFNDNIADIAVSLYINLLTNFIPSIPEHQSLLLTTMELLSSKLSTNQIYNKMKLLNSLNIILDSIIAQVEDNFSPMDVFMRNNEPLLLTSDRFNKTLLQYVVGDHESNTIINILSNLYESTTLESSYIRQSLQKLHLIHCKQSIIGHPAINKTTSIVTYIFSKSMPYGLFRVNDKIIVDFHDNLQQYYDYHCPVYISEACSEICLQFGYISSDIFINDDSITISEQSKELLTTSYNGANTNAIKIISQVITIASTIATEKAKFVGKTPVKIYINIQEYIQIRSSNEDVFICMYRDITNIGNDIWQLNLLSPPQIIEINNIAYFGCEYDFFGEYALGTLLLPDITSSISYSQMSSEMNIITSMYVNDTITVSPSIDTNPTFDPLQVIPVLSVIVVIGALLTLIGGILAAFIIWRKKNAKKAKVAAVEDVIPIDNSTEIQPTDELKKESVTGVTYGVIQLLGDGERFLLGRVNVLHTMRLRELRTQLVETFSQLKAKPFYLCTKELCDIDPATEQQQFVNLVYSNIVYIREITTITNETKRQFCVCGTAAQFECSGCNMKGYCSQECQQKHWFSGHQQVCQRISEKKSRTEILQRQQSTTTNNFISDNKRSSSNIRSPQSLPPIQLTKPIQNNQDLYNDLRKQIDSTNAVSPPPVTHQLPVLPKLPALPATERKPLLPVMIGKPPILSRSSSITSSTIKAPNSLHHPLDTDFHENHTTTSLKSPVLMHYPKIAHTKPILQRDMSVTSIESNASLLLQSPTYSKSKLPSSQIIEENNETSSDSSDSSSDDDNDVTESLPSLAIRRRSSKTNTSHN